MNFQDSLLLKQSSVVELTNQGELNVNLSLDNAPAFTSAILSGTVYDTTILTGTPVDGATVVVYDNTGAVVSFALTNASGQYEIIDLVDATAYTVNASKDGYTTSASSSFTASSATATTVNLVIVPNTNESLNTVYGIITDTSSAAVEGATAILLNSTTGDVITTTSTITDGEYAIYGIPSGNYLLKVGKTGYVSPSAVPITLTTTQNVSENLTLNTAGTGGVISGIITDSISNPVNNAFVGLYSVDVSNVPETLVDYTFTNSAGLYVFGDVATGSYVIKSKLSATI